MVPGNQRPGLGSSSLKSSTQLEMTVEIVGVSGVIMTTFDTLIDANFLFLLWLLIRQFVTSKIAPLN